MTAEDIKRNFENKLNERIKNQKVVFTKSKNERPHNGSSQEISDFLSKLQNKKYMSEVVEQTSERVIKLVEGYKGV